MSDQDRPTDDEAPAPTHDPHPELVRAEHVDLHQAAARRVEAGEVNVTQGAIGLARADRIEVTQGAVGIALGDTVTVRQGMTRVFARGPVHLEQSFARVVVAGEVEVGPRGFAGLVIAREVSGPGRILMDWRGGLALGAALGLAWAFLRTRAR
jgi:hypothetical protein